MSSLCSNDTGLRTGIWQRTDLASRFAQGSVANASTCSARRPLEMHGAFAPIVRSTKCISSCSYGPRHALWPLFFVHRALQFRPILNLVVRTFPSPAPCVHSNRALPWRVSMPSCNDTDYIRKLSLWKIFFVVYMICNQVNMNIQVFK